MSICLSPEFEKQITLKRKYTPGQRLNSAAEVMQALLDGQKITSTSQYLKYFHMVGGVVLNDDGFPKRDLSLDWQGYTIYTPPKRKVTIRKWVNILRFKDDGMTVIHDHDTEESAKEFDEEHWCSDAEILARAVLFEHEVEVSE